MCAYANARMRAFIIQHFLTFLHRNFMQGIWCSYISSMCKYPKCTINKVTVTIYKLFSSVQFVMLHFWTTVLTTFFVLFSKVNGKALKMHTILIGAFFKSHMHIYHALFCSKHAFWGAIHSKWQRTKAIHVHYCNSGVRRRAVVEGPKMLVRSWRRTTSSNVLSCQENCSFAFVQKGMMPPLVNPHIQSNALLPSSS